MTKDQFLNLSVEEQLYTIYAGLPKSTAPGESPIGGLFGPNRPKVVTPVKPRPVVPVGFEEIFGAYPDHLPENDPLRKAVDNKIKRFGGIYNLSQLPSFSEKISLARANNLGDPIAYVFDGDVFVTFRSLKGVTWYRDLSEYMDMSNYYEMIRVAVYTREHILGGNE